MKIAPADPAPRCDSVLDSQLTPAQADDLAHRLDHGMSVAEAAGFLADEFGITLSRPSISRWASRRRRARTGQTFARLAEENAALAGQPAPAADSLVDANAVLLNQLLNVAVRCGDPYAMMHASKVYANLIGAAARNRRSETGRMAFELAKTKWEFEAARAALEHAGSLGEIHGRSDLDEREKMDRALVQLFGVPGKEEEGLSEAELRRRDVALRMAREERDAARLAEATARALREIEAGPDADDDLLPVNGTGVYERTVPPLFSPAKVCAPPVAETTAAETTAAEPAEPATPPPPPPVPRKPLTEGELLRRFSPPPLHFVSD